MIYQDISLTPYNSFLLDAQAEFFYEYISDDDLREALSWAHEQEIPIKILGGGTNILLKTTYIHGLILHINRLSFSKNNSELTFGAGVDSAMVALYAYSFALEGAEFLYALPGTIGGAVFMNARAFDRSISDIIVSARVMDYNGAIFTVTREEMNFSYKDSIFQHKSWIILEATFRLRSGNPQEITQKMDENIQGRRARGHFDYPSCGSVFKNPYDVGIPAGKLIETAGLKGLTCGGAAVFEKHANFIINKNNATGNNILSLITTLQKGVLSAHGVQLKPEVQVWD